MIFNSVPEVTFTACQARILASGNGPIRSRQFSDVFERASA